MKNKIIAVVVVALAAAFYFGYLRVKVPSMKQVEKAMPVQVDSAKTEKLAEIKDKAGKAISAAEKELKKPDDKTGQK